MTKRIFCVKELKLGGVTRVSKYYPTWLGCKRERNRIHRDFPFWAHIVSDLFVDEETAKKLLREK